VKALRQVGVTALRDARRLARRPAMLGIRLAISGLGLLVVLSVWQSLPSGLESAAFGYAGRELFTWWRALVFLSCWGLGPLVVALGIQEERDGGTLEMLALTQLTPYTLFVGVVSARVAWLGLVVLGSLPMLGVAIGLGGFGVGEVVYTAVHGVVGMGLLSAVAALFALSSRRPMLPAIAAWLWGFFLFSVLQIVLFMVLGVKQIDAGRFNPFVAGVMGQSGWPGVALLLLGSVGVARLGAVVLDIALSQDDDEEFGVLSPARWTLDRIRRMGWMGLLGSGLLISMNLLFYPRVWLHEYLWLLWWGSIELLTLVSAAVVSLLWAVDRLHGVGRRGKIRAAEAIRRSLSETRIGALPVYWRDRLVTGPTAGVATGVASVVLVLAAGVAWMGGGSGVSAVLTVWTLMAAIGVGVLVGVGGAIDEVRCGMWGLLSMSKVGPMRLVGEKLLATIRSMFPLLGVAWVIQRFAWGLDPLLGVRDLLVGVWVVLLVLWPTILALWIGLRAGPQWVWPAVMATGTIGTLCMVYGTSSGRSWGALLVPTGDAVVWLGWSDGIAPELLGSIVLYGGAVGVLWKLAARSLGEPRATPSGRC